MGYLDPVILMAFLFLFAVLGYRIVPLHLTVREFRKNFDSTNMADLCET